MWAEYAASGQGASGVTASLTRTPSLLDRDVDFASAGSGCSTVLSRGYGTLTWQLGGDPGSRIGFPRGKLRMELVNTESYWAGVNLQVWYELDGQ